MSGARIELDGVVTEEGGQQFLSGRGTFSDGYTNVHRIEPHGFMSNPVKGAKALLLSPNGNPDEAYIVGGEHPEHRPAGLPAGAAALYDASGNIIKLIGSGAVFDFGSREATLTAGDWTINCSSGVTINSPTVTVNGNIQLNGSLSATGSVTDGDGDGGA